MAMQGKDLATTLCVLNGGVLRLALENMTGVPEIWMWAFSYHLSDTELADLTRPWFDAVRERVARAT